MSSAKPITLFLCGDVMLGRGVDQILPFPLPSDIHEGYIQDALDYVRLAEQKNGAIPRAVSYEYIWGDALDVLQQANPDVRIINLETAVTTNSQWEPKGINYRMHPLNISCLTMAQVDVAVLANNHVLDWKQKGLSETIETLQKKKIQTVGVGGNFKEASAPAMIQVQPKASVAVFAFALESSGVPEEWASRDHKPGVNFLKDLSASSLKKVRQVIQSKVSSENIVVLSIHWGANWGYEISKEQSKFARILIDEGLVDVIYGHSSHHPKAIEVYREKLILYGCGDLINDYEGIRGFEPFRADLVLMYFPKIHPKTKNLLELKLVPFHLRNFRLTKPELKDIQWLHALLAREEKKFNHQVAISGDQQTLSLLWNSTRVPSVKLNSMPDIRPN